MGVSGERTDAEFGEPEPAPLDPAPSDDSKSSSAVQRHMPHNHNTTLILRCDGSQCSSCEFDLLSLDPELPAKSSAASSLRAMRRSPGANFLFDWRLPSAGASFIAAKMAESWSTLLNLALIPYFASRLGRSAGKIRSDMPEKGQLMHRALYKILLDPLHSCTSP